MPKVISLRVIKYKMKFFRKNHTGPYYIWRRKIASSCRPVCRAVLTREPGLFLNRANKPFLIPEGVLIHLHSDWPGHEHNYLILVKWDPKGSKCKIWKFSLITLIIVFSGYCWSVCDIWNFCSHFVTIKQDIAYILRMVIKSGSAVTMVDTTFLSHPG